MRYYEESGAFDRVNEPPADSEDTDKKLASLYRDCAWPAFLRLAVKTKKNIVVSAPTFAGKTEFINMLLKEISPAERIVTIEDARELRPPQANAVNLLYSRGNQGTANVTPVELMEASLRLSPDRVIPGELRGAEAYVALEMLEFGARWLHERRCTQPAPNTCSIGSRRWYALRFDLAACGDCRLCPQSYRCRGADCIATTMGYEESARCSMPPLNRLSCLWR